MEKAQKNEKKNITSDVIKSIIPHRSPMSNVIKHPYHLVEISPWPLYASISAMGLTSGIVA
jgi:hypothetical protein